MKKLILSFIVCMLLISIASASLCQDITEEKNIACEIITEKMDCSTNAFIYSASNLSNNFSIALNKMDATCGSACFYNFTFIYPLGDYGINTCDGKYARIKVVENGSVLLSSTGVVSGGWFPPASSMPDLTGMSPTNQAKEITKAFFIWIKDLFVSYYWLIIPLFLVAWHLIRKKKDKVVKVLDSASGVSK